MDNEERERLKIYTKYCIFVNTCAFQLFTLYVRFLAVKELQEEVVKLKNRPSRGIVAGGGGDTSGPSNEVQKFQNVGFSRIIFCNVDLK